MVDQGKKHGDCDKATDSGAPTPQSVEIASRGIRTARDGANFQAALIGDIMTGVVKEKTANAACNAMGKLLKIVDMEHRYGGNTGSGATLLRLADPDDSERLTKKAKRDELRRQLAELESE